ncbi:MAG: magnesium and cobalt transport protein CorA, partial [Nitrospirota bacterium]
MKTFLKVSKKAGLPPGTPIHVGERKAASVKMTVLDYDEEQCEFRELKQVEECFPYKDKPSTTWINIDGLHDVSLIEKIGLHFGVHPLIIEDILNTGQRPKIDIFEDFLFVVLKMHSYNDGAKKIGTEQISLILGKNFVLSFQEKEGDIFEPLRARIKNAKGKVRKAGADYLLHSIIDSVVDNYFKVLEGIGEEIEEVEDDLIDNPTPDIVRKIHALKRESLFLRKSVWPLREVISTLEREESSLIKK